MQCQLILFYLTSWGNSKYVALGAVSELHNEPCPHDRVSMLIQQLKLHLSVIHKDPICTLLSHLHWPASLSVITIMWTSFSLHPILFSLRNQPPLRSLTSTQHCICLPGLPPAHGSHFWPEFFSSQGYRFCSFMLPSSACSREFSCAQGWVKHSAPLSIKRLLIIN